ncbi:MAG TPA: hypothetical protein VHM72_08715 [Solirubrobacteraceae bacterium]|nr:hypothetical protein [Solirubrobacteraceae bacterium]
MLAYVFWHRAAATVAGGEYEDACRRFHRGLATHRPGGLIGTACLRAERLPWLAYGGPGLEDWYIVEDFAAVGVLNEAAVARGHLSAHDRAAGLMGEGTGSIYRLLDGTPELSSVRVAAWISPARGHDVSLLDDFLADGMERSAASLWRRQLALGPAPELCLLAAHAPDGLRSTRLPEGWRVDVDSRAPL